MLCQDVQNEILSTLQQSELVNFGNAPNWNSVTNPEFDRPTILHWINRSIIKIYRDVSDIDVAAFTATFLSTANTAAYGLPPPIVGTPNPPVGELRRLFYSPVGQPQINIEFEPGVRMLPWSEFQRYTAAGFFSNTSPGNMPSICAVTPDRAQVQFYPGSANAGDTITLSYSPIPTAGTLVPLMINDADPIVLPDDFQDLIQIYALSKLWPKARAMAAAKDALAQYYEQLNYIRGMWLKRSGGDKLRISDAAHAMMTSGPYGWPV